MRVNSMKNKILFIVEGNKTEPNVLKHLVNTLGIESSQLYSYNTNIYSLYNKLKNTFDDDDEYDLLSFLIELEEEKKNQNKVPDDIVNLSRKEVSEIYLLFDSDTHHSEEYNEIPTIENFGKLNDLIEMFNDETENGKIYISYPMVESLATYDKILDSSVTFSLFKADTAKDKTGKRFKSISNGHILNKPLDDEFIEWIQVFHIMLCNFIYQLDSVEYEDYIQNVSPLNTFQIQKNKFVADDFIYVYSGIAEFLLDYIKEEDFPDLTTYSDITPLIKNMWDPTADH